MKRILGSFNIWLTLCVGSLLISNLSYADHDIRIAAHEIDEAANHVYTQAYRENNRGRDNNWVLSRLYDLAIEAEHFHHLVESYYANPHHIDEDFRRLEYAFYDAADAMRYGYYSDHVWHDFYRCEDAMTELRYTFGRGGHDRPGRPGRPGRPYPEATDLN